MSSSTLSRRSFACSAIMAAIASATVVPMALADNDEDPKQFSVSASSTVLAIPDVADISLSAETTGEDAVTAQNEAAAAVEAALASFKELGVPEDSTKVSSMSVWPVYDNGTTILGTRRTPKIVGYEVSVSLQVTGVSVTIVGDVIAAALDAGINQVGGISYSCSTFDDLYDQALSQACKRAEHKASVAAEALGYTIIGVDDVRIGYENQTYRASSNSYDYEEYAVAEEAGGAVATPVAIDPGSVEISASVDIDFLAVKQG